MIHFELIFMYGMKWKSNFIILHMGVRLSQHYFMKRLLFFPLNFLSTLVKNQLSLNINVYSWTLNCITLLCMFVLLQVTHSVDLLPPCYITIWIRSLHYTFFQNPIYDALAIQLFSRSKGKIWPNGNLIWLTPGCH